MIKLHALKIDVVATLGKRYWLTEVRPVYKYTDNKKLTKLMAIVIRLFCQKEVWRKYL